MINLLKFQFYFESPIILSGNPFIQTKPRQKVENIHLASKTNHPEYLPSIFLL
jgi:hypothetical protein